MPNFKWGSGEGTFKKMKIKKNKTTVRIYSLLPKTQFEWVVKLLQDDSIVWPSSRHKYVILYHSKSHGRVNLTDGTDPLYNKFLPRKASKYGKENIVVVLDHLGDDIDGMKARIERSQRSVFKYAKYMFYFKNGSDEDEIQEKLKLKQFLSSTDNS